MEFQIQNLAVPSVYLLILFLGYPSQYLLMHLEPRPLTKNEIWAANVLLVLIFITYTRSVFVDAGTVPKDWAERLEGKKENTHPSRVAQDCDRFASRSRTKRREIEQKVARVVTSIDIAMYTLSPTTSVI